MTSLPEKIFEALVHFFNNKTLKRYEEAQEIQPLELYTGLLFGTRCSGPMLIHLLPNPPLRAAHHSYDLNFEDWLVGHLDTQTTAYCLNKTRLRVDRFPFTSQNLLDHAFTIIFSEQGRWIAANDCIRDLSKGRYKSWTGNVIVVKHAHGNRLTHVRERDIELIVAIVMSAIETHRLPINLEDDIYL